TSLRLWLRSPWSEGLVSDLLESLAVRKLVQRFERQELSLRSIGHPNDLVLPFRSRAKPQFVQNRRRIRLGMLNGVEKFDCLLAEAVLVHHVRRLLGSLDQYAHLGSHVAHLLPSKIFLQECLRCASPSEPVITPV